LDVTATWWVGETYRHRARQQGQDQNRLFENHSNAAVAAQDARPLFYRCLHMTLTGEPEIYSRVQKLLKTQTIVVAPVGRISFPFFCVM